MVYSTVTILVANVTSKFTFCVFKVKVVHFVGPGTCAPRLVPLPCGLPRWHRQHGLLGVNQAKDLAVDSTKKIYHGGTFGSGGK